jgi:5-methylcytosine-specific restriction endonuclease McrA
VLVSALHGAEGAADACDELAMDTNKQCPTCKLNKPRAEFARCRREKDGLQWRCKPCHRDAVRSSSKKHNDRYVAYQRAYKKRRYARERAEVSRRKLCEKGALRAHAAVYRALRSGLLLKPDSCSMCGAVAALHGHHHSYETEHLLDVQWLCRRCHGAVHAAERDAAMVAGAGGAP